MEDFIRQTSDGKIGSVWIDGRKLAEFAQAEDEASIDALREELGVAPEDAEAFAEAVATGTDVELDAAKLYTKIGTDERYQALKPHLRLEQSDISAFEAEALEASRRSEAEEMVEMMEIEAERIKKSSTAAAEIAKDLRKKLEATGRKDLFGKRGADAQRMIDLFLVRESRKAELLGKTLDELWKPGEIDVVERDGNVYIVIPKKNEAARSEELAAQTADGGERTLEQTIDEGLDLEKRASALPLATEERGTITAEDRRTMSERFGDGIVNDDTGLVVTLSTGKKGAGHIAHSAFGGEGVEKRVLIASFFRLPELVKSALLAKTTGDRKPSEPKEAGTPGSVKRIRRFLVPVRYEGETYVLKLTAKEYEDGRAEIDMDDGGAIDVKLYDQTVAKKISGDSSASQEADASPPADIEPAPDISLSLGEMAVDVKDTLDEELGLGPYLTREEYEAQTGRVYRYDRIPGPKDETYYQIGAKRKGEMDAALQKHRPDLNEKQRAESIAVIEQLGEEVKAGGSPKVEKAATHWLLKGHIVLPEDNYKVLDALKICEQQGLDPMRFDDPNAILAQYTIKETASERRVNPDTVPEFSEKRELPGGITVYTVQDDKKGQSAVRKIIDTHWGEDANPWCLAARNDNAWEMWERYNGTEKRIAFKDGKLLAFSASDSEETTWWDREDVPSQGIPTVEKKGGDEVHYAMDEDSGKKRKTSETLKDGTERSWHENGQMEREVLPDGTERRWHGNGQMAIENLPDGTRRGWYENGQIENEVLPDGTGHSWYADGTTAYEYLPDGPERKWHQNGRMKSEILPDGTKREWYRNGQIESEVSPDGTIREWYENGQMESEVLTDGTERSWYENGRMKNESLSDGTKREWYIDGRLAKETLPDGTTRRWSRWDKAGNPASETYYQRGEKAERKLARDEKAWEGTIDKFGRGELQQNRPVRVMTTPLALNLAGGGEVGFKEIVTTPNVLDKILNKKHAEITPEILKQIPRALADPIMVFRSATVPGSYVSMLELKDSKGGTIVVPVALNASKPGAQAFMTSAYGQLRKRADGSVKVNNQWFADQIEAGNLRYMNTKKSASWARDVGLQSPIMSLPAETLHANSIKTEADLVKLREEHPGLYQMEDASAQVELDADTRAFAEAIRNRGNLNPRTSIKVMTTPLALHLAGADVKPVFMTAGKINRILEDHPGMTLEILEQLPAALAEPIAVFESATEKNALVAMLDLRDANGASVVAALHLNVSKGRDRLVVNRLASAYGKDREKNPSSTGQSWLQSPRGAAEKGSLIENRVPNDPWFVNEVENGRLRYVNRGKATAWTDRTGLPLLPVDASQQRIHADNIKTEADLVKLREEYPGLYQGEDGSGASGGVRGSISFSRREAVIELTANANKSTFLHEMAHYFLYDMAELALRDDAPQALKDDWTIAAKELGIEGVSIDELLSGNMTEATAAMWRNAQERFAAGFEKYLFKGKSPIPELKKLFRAFKRWLVSIYRALSNIRYQDADGNWQAFELSDEMRGVYDRMLASEEAIENEAIMRGLDASVFGEEIPQEAFETLDDETYEMIEAAKERLLAEMLGEMAPARQAALRRKADSLIPFVRSIVEKEPVYRAIGEMKKNPALRMSTREITSGWGETILASLPENVDAPGGVPVAVAAAEYGFGSAQEFVEALANALPLKVEIERRAMEQAMRKAPTLKGKRLSERAGEILDEGDEALDMRLMEREILRRQKEKEALNEMAARVEAERENPLNRRNVIKAIRKLGGLSYKAVKEGYGVAEARELVERMGGSIWRGGKFGLDKMAQRLQAKGVPVRDDTHLFEILLSEDTPLLSLIDEAYQKGYIDARAKDREKRRKAFENKQQRREWLLLHNEKLKNMKETIKSVAEGLIGAKEGREAITSKPYVRAANRARREAERAMAKGDWETAAAAKDREIINTACARAASRAKNEHARILYFLRKYAERPHKTTFGVAPAYLAQIDAMLERFNLKRKDDGEQRPLKSLDKFVEELKAAGEPVLIPDEILDANYRKHWSKMSMDEIRKLRDAVKNIERLGRWEKRFLRFRYNVQIDTVAAQIAKRMSEYYGFQGLSDLDPGKTELKTLFEKLKNAPEEFMASLEMVEFLTRAMDGYEDLGTAHQYIFQPIRDALTAETEMLNDVFAKLQALRERVYAGNRPNFMLETVELDIPMRDIDGNISKSGRTWKLTREELVSAALNMGNEGNLQRLRDGWHLSGSDLQKIVDALSEQDTRFVQGVWDLLESLRPMVKETAELMTGVTPEWVEPTPLVTKYGTLRGGYYPIVTDTRYSHRAAQQQEIGEVMSTINLDYLSGTTKHGHRKERANNILGRPPELRLSVLDKHLVTVVHDAALAPAVRDVNKLIHHRFVRDAVKQALGDEKNKVLNHWVRAVANNNRNNGLVRDEADRGIGFMHRGAMMMGLGANVSGAILQVFGYAPLAKRIGPLRVVRAIASAMAHPKETVSFVLEKSAFMREQIKGQDRDLRRMSERWTSERSGKLDAFRSLTLSQYAFFQNMCNIPGWLESYKLGLKKFDGDDAKAVKYADSIIRQTQGAGGIADLTRFETSGSWKKMFTLFFGWFRILHNNNVEAFRRARYEKGVGHKLGIFLNHTLFILILPRLAETIIRGDGPDEDDDETWPKYLMKQTLLAPFMAPLEAIPVVRDVVGGVNAISGYRGGYRFTPMSAVLESVTKLINRTWNVLGDLSEGDEPKWGGLWKSALDALGYLGGLPMRQVEKWWDVFRDSMEGEEEFLAGAYRVLLGKGKRDAK